MTDWQKSDLALCVRGGFIAGLNCEPYPTSGAVYRVTEIIFYDDDELWLEVEGAPDNIDSDDGHNHGPVWIGARFRRIPPHIPDAEDAETIRLLTGQPAQVTA